jgi:tetratricopeptide (TPR) repeat protein
MFLAFSRCIRARGRAIGAVSIVVVLTSVSSAHAQGCAGGSSPEELAEARQLFVSGSADVDAGRWSDAIAKFDRAYSLSCAPSALYNLAMALRALGRHRDARDAFDRLLREHPNLTGELRTNGTNYREEEATRVAVLILAGIDANVSPELHFDGETLADSGARPIQIETDAGSHSFTAQIPEHQPFLWEGRLSDGQHEMVQVTFAPLAAREEMDWVVPVIIGVAAAAVVGLAIGVGYYLYDSAQIRPLNPGRTIVLSGR